MIKDKVQTIRNYRGVYKNYFSVFFFKLYFKRKESLQNDNVKIKVILKDGKEINAPYGWVIKFANFHTYQNENISNLSLELRKEYHFVIRAFQ